MNQTSTTQYLRPASSIIENKDGFLIEADLPGVTLEGVRLKVENNVLTIEGQRPPAPAASAGANGNRRTLHRESAGFDYRRAFELGRDVDAQRVSAKFNQGVLQIFLPKSEAAKPRQVTIGG